MTIAEGLSTADADGILASIVLTGEGRQDPYAGYRRLRSEAPRWVSATGAIVVSTYRDCHVVLRNPKLGRAEADMDIPSTLSGRDRVLDESTRSMLLLNPPDHTRIRSLVSRAFTPRRVESLRPQIQSLLDPLIDEIADNGGGEIVGHLAAQFPISVISGMLGVPTEDAERIRPLVRAVTKLIDSASSDEEMSQGRESLIELAEYFSALIARKREDPDDAMLSALIEVEEGGDRLSHDELLANTILLYSAGFETTSNLIGNGLWLLLQNPEATQRLRDDVTLIPSAVMEILRADSPVQMNMRMALEPVDVFDETHPRGTTFIVLQGSANHDEAAYESPENFDVARFVSPDQTQPLSFGWGSHHCLGAHLARAEGEIVFRTLLERFERIELDVDTLGGPVPRYRDSFTLRGLESLPILAS